MGSFQDRLLKEVDFRERNLKLAGMCTVIELFTNMQSLLVILLGGEKGAELNKIFMKNNESLKDVYEAEVFGDRYLAEYKAMRQKIQRELKIEELRKQREEDNLMKKAENLSE